MIGKPKVTIQVYFYKNNFQENNIGLQLTLP